MLHRRGRIRRRYKRGGRLIDALDGNAIAGSLIEIFGAEMTDAACACAHCGAQRRVAELTVYMRGPGTVVRCRSCEGIVMTLVEIRGITCVDLRGLAMLEQPS